jgi:hypothetical protein
MTHERVRPYLENYRDLRGKMRSPANSTGVRRIGKQAPAEISQSEKKDSTGKLDYLLPMTSLAMVANCMFDVPS